MEDIATAITRNWSLAQLVACLSRHEQVEGVLQIGSLAEGALTAASDYDLVIVLRDAPQPWYVGVTHIDHRFTDLIFVATAEIARAGALVAQISHTHSLAPVVRWLKQGYLLWERAGQIQQAQHHVQQGDWVQPPDDDAAYGMWFAINYNLAQAQRMAQAEDPLYQTTLHIRLAVYAPADLWFGYFSVRRLSFTGDKAAVKYLLAHDPEFLVLYRQFIDATDPAQKMALYTQVAARATAPLGGLWPSGATVMNIRETLALWQQLIASG